MKIRTLRLCCLVLLFVMVMSMAAACNNDDDKKADTSEEMTTIGIVNYLTTLEGTIDTFKASMAELGYVEGENVTYIYNGVVQPTPEALDAEIQALLDKKVDLLVTVGTPSSQRAKELTAETKVPVLFTNVSNPVGAGLVEDILKPGGNMTGIDVGAHIVEKSLEWLITLVPGAKRIYVPYTAQDRAAASLLPLLDASAEKLGVEIVKDELAAPEDAIPALEKAAPDVDAIFFMTTSFSASGITPDFVRASISLGLPMGSSFPLATGGTTMFSLSVDFDQVSDQAARLADQIIKGGNPADIPIEQAAFTFDINLSVANLLGLEISDSILQQANNIIRDATTLTPQPTVTATP